MGTVVDFIKVPEHHLGHDTARDYLTAVKADIERLNSEGTPSEAGAVAALIEGMRKTIETQDLEQRLSQLEKSMENKK